MKSHIIGLLLGLCVGVLDCALFAASGMPLTLPAIMSALIFWTAVGWIVHKVDMSLPSVVKGLIVSLLLNLPWVIEFVIIQQMSDLLLPMIAVATLFGALLGFASGFLKARLA